MKTCYINQPYGLGDILLCEPIARHYFEQGYKIVYWVKDEYLWIQDYIKYIDFISINDNYNTLDEPVFTEDIIYIPAIYKRVSEIDEWRRVGWLEDKYTISKLDKDLWKTFSFDRNTEKENNLFNYLNLENKKYILINGHSSAGYRDLKIESECDVINMSNISGYSMLDWYKVMQEAEAIHTVSTSVLLPIVNMKHKNVTIYERNLGDNTFYSIKDLFLDFNFKYE